MNLGNSSYFVPVVTPAATPSASANSPSSLADHLTSSGNNGTPICLYMKDHGKALCDRLQMLRTQQSLIDLDIVCDDQHWKVHKIILAAASKFFKTHLCKAKVMVPVIIKLEDFGLELNPEAVGYLIEFVYKGEVVIPGGKLSHVCHAAHALGVNGLTDFLPENVNNSKNDNVQQQPASQQPEVSPAEQIPVITLDDQRRNQMSNSSQEVHHVVVSIASQYPNLNQNFEPLQSTVNANNFLSKNSNQNAGYFVGSSSQEQDHGVNSSQYVQAVYPTPPQNLFETSSQHQVPNEDQLSSSSSLVLASYPVAQNNSDDPSTSTQGLGQQNLPFSPFPSLETPLKIRNELVDTDFNPEIQAPEEGGTIVGQSPGKLRVITQGLLEKNKDLTASKTSTATTQDNSNHQFLMKPSIPNLEDSNSCDKNLALENNWNDENQDVHWTLNTADTAKVGESSGSGENMFAIRSGVPLGFQRGKRKKSTSPNLEDMSSTGFKKPKITKQTSMKKCDLGVRKDLTLTPVATTIEDNVFQAEDISGGNRIHEFPLVQLDDEDGDCELVIHGSMPIINTSDASDRNESNIEGNEGLAQQSKDYQCVQCTKEFSREYELRQHVKHAHQMEENLCCPVCKVGEIVGKEALKIHLFKQHGIGEIFRCEECNFETSIKNTYEKHVSEVHLNKNVLECHKCFKQFKSKIGLKLHMKRHTNTEPFKCNCCEFSSAQRINMIRHMAVKHKKDLNGQDLKEEFKCEICDFKCVADFQLKDHTLRRHTSKEDMQFRCTICTYATVEKKALAKHIRCHTNERPFMCDTCGFSTLTSSSMARHKRTHSNTKPYKCETCKMSYADKKRLRDHMLKHEGKLPFQCSYCKFQTRRKDNLNAHIRRLHMTLKISKKPELKSDIQRSEGGHNEKEDNAGGKQSFAGEANIADKSHIVGHINQDGSIRPVSSSSLGVGKSISAAESPKETISVSLAAMDS